MRRSYPSDIEKCQFDVIRPMLETAKKRTRPRNYDLYDIFCAIQYRLREGCRWRSLPHDFPKWENVYYHYQIWSKQDENGISLLDRIMVELVKFEREINGRKPEPTLAIVDSKSTKNAFTAEEKGYDGGKKYQESKDI